MNRSFFLIATSVLLLVLVGCSGDADPTTTTDGTTTSASVTTGPTTTGPGPDGTDLYQAIIADPAEAAGVASYRQRRTVEIAGTRAEQEGVAGSFQVSYEITTDPEALQMAVDSSENLVPIFFEREGAVTGIIAIGDETWARDGGGDWNAFDPGTSTANPLFGPFAGIVETMEQLIAPSAEALTFSGTTAVNGQDLDLYEGAEFVAVGPDGTGIPVTDLQVWIDPAGYMTQALITVTSGSEADGDELAYILLYEVFDFGAPIVIEPPA